jgi:phenylacetate-CoA ligase
MEIKMYNPVVESMTHNELQDMKLKRLKDLLEKVYKNNKFYRAHFDKAGVLLNKINSFDDYQKIIPTVSKADFMVDQNENPPYGNRLNVAKKDIAFTFLTSGTSGQGQEVHAFTANDMKNLVNAWSTSYLWNGVVPGDIGYLVVPLGITGGPISLFQSFVKYGLQTFNVANLDGKAKLSLMMRFPPHFMSLGPVYLRRLTGICTEMGIDPKRDFIELKAIKLGSCGYSVGWAQNIERFWGCRLVDTYASTQLGTTIASSCEYGVYHPDGKRGIMHFLEHMAFIEVVDPETGENVNYGEEGELIITPFDREGVPIIRFKTGDKVVFLSHDYCPCGRPFDGIMAGTVARYDSMIKIKGMNMWPEAVDEVVLAFEEIEEYNGRVFIEETGREVAEVQIEFKSNQLIEKERRNQTLIELKKKLKEKTAVNMKVIEASKGSIEKFTYKEKRWKDLRKQRL